MRYIAFLAGIIVVALIGIASGATVTQKTGGICSPAIINEGPKGNLTIQINCNNIDPKSRELLQKALAKLATVDELPARFDELLQEIWKLRIEYASNPKHTQELIALLYRHAFNSTQEEAADWAKELFDSSDQKTSDLKAASSLGKELAEKLALQAQPLFDWVMQQADDRVFQLHKKGALAPYPNAKFQPYYKTRMPLYSVDQNRKIKQYVLDARFPAGGRFSLYLTQGYVFKGKPVALPRLDAEGDVPGQRYRLFRLDLGQSPEFLWTESSFGRSGGTIIKPKLKDTMLDSDFLRTISVAIGDALSHIYLHDAAAR